MRTELNKKFLKLSLTWVISRKKTTFEKKLGLVLHLQRLGTKEKKHVLKTGFHLLLNLLSLSVADSIYIMVQLYQLLLHRRLRVL